MCVLLSVVLFSSCCGDGVCIHVRIRMYTVFLCGYFCTYVCYSCTMLTFPKVVSRWVEVCSVIVFVYWCSFRGSLSSALNLSSSFGVASCGCIWY